jgi:hypothetical protein
LSALSGPWGLLGIAPTGDAREIRRAYAARLKITHPEDDPEGFQRLRAAYEWALASAKRIASAGQPVAAAPRLPDADSAPLPRADTPPTGADTAAAATARVDALRTRLDEDPAQRVLDERLRTLADELRRPKDIDIGAAQAALSTILESQDLDRFDVFERADAGIAELLARAIPGSDPLLKAASDRFEWAERSRERATPNAAGFVARRLRDLTALRKLTTGDSDHARTWARLRAPMTPWRRIRRAYLPTRWPELELLFELEADYPALLAELPEQNVAWWRRFASRPRVSVVAVLVGVIAGAVLAGLTTDLDPLSPWKFYVAWAIGAVGFVLFPPFALELPIAYVERRWGSRPPVWFSFGWLPASIVLLALAVLVAAILSLAWLVVCLGALCAIWAAIAEGRVARVLVGRQISFMNSRLVRVLLINAIAGFWLAVMNENMRGVLGTQLHFSIAAALTASALGRNVLVTGFAANLSLVRQKTACLVACGVAVVLGIVIVRIGAVPAWQPALLAAVIACVILRRAVPFDIGGIRINAYIFVFAGMLGVRMLSAIKDVARPAGIESFDRAETLMTGALAMLVGILITTARWWSTLPRRR